MVTNVGIEHHCYYARDICQFLNAILTILRFLKLLRCFLVSTHIFNDGLLLFKLT